MTNQQNQVSKIKNTFVGKLFFGGALACKATGVTIKASTAVVAGGLYATAKAVDVTGNYAADKCFNAGDYLSGKSTNYLTKDLTEEEVKELKEIIDDVTAQRYEDSIESEMPIKEGEIEAVVENTVDNFLKAKNYEKGSGVPVSITNIKDVQKAKKEKNIVVDENPLTKALDFAKKAREEASSSIVKDLAAQ